jgi:hypothetical protein
LKPIWASSRAEPTSQGLGMTKHPGSVWSCLKARARAERVSFMVVVVLVGGKETKRAGGVQLIAGTGMGTGMGPGRRISLSLIG